MDGLTVGSIISGGFSKGFKNVLPLTANIILWILTIWIPYLNIGTTIGLATIALKMSEGKMISGVEIFKPVFVFAAIGEATHGFVSALLYIVAAILYFVAASIMVGAQATIYEKLVK